MLTDSRAEDFSADRRPDALVETHAETHADASPATGEPRFAGKTAIITGVSDRGIGGAIAERLAREGAAVAILGQEEPRRVLKLLRRLNNGRFWRQCDVTRADQVSSAVEAVVDEFGQVDYLINNAGIEAARRLDDVTDAQCRELLESNLYGAIQVTRALLPRLRQPGGVIVNVASALALGGCDGFSVYSASKAGLVGFTQSLAWELAPRGVRVVAIAPGLVYTPMIHKYVAGLTAEQRQRVQASHPLGVSTPHDVADAVAFLVSNDARRITGITLPIGWSPHFPLPFESLLS